MKLKKILPRNSVVIQEVVFTEFRLFYVTFDDEIYYITSLHHLEFTLSEIEL